MNVSLSYSEIMKWNEIIFTRMQEQEIFDFVINARIDMKQQVVIHLGSWIVIHYLPKDKSLIITLVLVFGKQQVVKLS